MFLDLFTPAELEALGDSWDRAHERRRRSRSEDHGAALGHRVEIGDVEDALTAHGTVRRPAAAAMRHGRRVDVEVADELRELGPGQRRRSPAPLPHSQFKAAPSSRRSG